MGSTSTVELLPEHIGEEVNRLIRAKATIAQIVDRVAEMGETVSKSAVGRHTKKIKEVTERIRKSREIANVLVEKFGDEPESKTARFNIELMHSVVTDIVMKCSNDNESDVALDAGGAMFLSKALDHLSRAKKTDAETIRKAREEAAKDAREAIKKSKVGTADQREELIKAVDEVLGVKRS